MMKSYAKKRKGVLPFFANRERAEAEARRRDEYEYRTEMFQIRRQATQMQRNTEKARAEAYRLEVSGDHAGALSKANDAINNEKAYKTAMDTMARCNSMHAQAQIQRNLTDLLTKCEKVSRAVVQGIDTEGAMSAQIRLQEANDALELAHQEMTAIQEGYVPEDGSDICSSASEQALADIMASHAPKTAAQPVCELPGAESEPAAAETPQAEKNAEAERTAILARRAEQRKLLAELV